MDDVKLGRIGQKHRFCIHIIWKKRKKDYTHRIMLVIHNNYDQPTGARITDDVVVVWVSSANIVM